MSTAAERVRAYVDCLDELYAEGDPMPERMVIDTTGLWRLKPQQSVDLTYADLLKLLTIAEAQGEPCGQRAVVHHALTVDGSGYLSDPCVEPKGHKGEHRSPVGSTWIESVR